MGDPVSPPDPAADEVEVEHAEDLYGLDPASFTAARNALAKRLRGRGEKAEAAEVAKLRRPPITAWALNRVARDERELIDSLVRVGDELGAAMERALSGDASGVRGAQLQERAAVEAALDAATTHLDAVGHRPTEQARQRMAQTLRACLVDDEARAKLVRGVLEGDVDAVGFGGADLSGFTFAAPTAPAAAGSPAPTAAAAGPTTPREPGPARVRPGTLEPEPEPAEPEPERAGPEPAEAKVEPRPAAPDPEAVRLAAFARERRDQLAEESARAAADVLALRAEVERRQAAEDDARRRTQEAAVRLAAAEQAAALAELSLRDGTRLLEEAEQALREGGGRG